MYGKALSTNARNHCLPWHREGQGFEPPYLQLRKGHGLSGVMAFSVFAQSVAGGCASNANLVRVVNERKSPTFEAPKGLLRKS